jgi:protein phosphatase
MLGSLKKILRLSQHPITFYGRTDTGKVRSHNEDSFCILRKKRLFVVADGMGGHNAGEVASRECIEALVEFFNEDTAQRMRGNNNLIEVRMIEAFHHANKVVMKKAASDPAHRGMGCTLVTCFLDEKTLHTCHVGDARCYLFAGTDLIQITTDHTGVTYYSKQRQQGEDDTMVNQTRNVVTRAIGFPFPQDPEYHRNPLADGNKVLLCSDGLWSMVPDDHIKEILKTSSTPEHACNQLILAANDRGGRDNITALVIFI